ncbi:MAG: ribosome small subunit-dependent GTPase A [Planctomycetes bacterium]|nr:ribosome small subunit-dependent GTPase A [Planctomycetota bacterium]
MSASMQGDSSIQATIAAVLDILMVMAKKKKKGKKVRVAFRRNRTQPARDKSWTRQFNEHGFENTDTVNRESLIPKGDMSRKRTIIEDEDTSELNLREGRAIAMRGLIVEVDDGERVWPCTVRRILRTRLIDERHPVAVGDIVQFMISAEASGADQAGVIYSVYARTSQLTRRSGERVHVIAANVDQVLIVASADEPPLKPQLIDRYLVAAHAGDITPLICINKIDLGDDEEIASVAEMYCKIGYRVILASAATGEGIDALKTALAGKETVVAGQSGVGKSTLLNVMQPGLQLATAEVSQSNFKGKHTTTTAQLLKLAFGGYVVDTPGIRSYDLAVVPKNEFELHFVEFVAHVPHCRFPDCTHIHEGECAIKQAVEDELIDPRRYESYCRLYEED